MVTSLTWYLSHNSLTSTLFIFNYQLSDFIYTLFLEHNTPPYLSDMSYVITFKSKTQSIQTDQKKYVSSIFSALS